MRNLYVAILATCLGTIGCLTAEAQGTADPNTFYGTGAGGGFSDQGNSAFGFDALNGNTIGFENTATGAHALYGNQDGAGNTATGWNALYNNGSGADNTATGAEALESNFGFRINEDYIGGMENTATGSGALRSNISGMDNVATGYLALFSNIGSSDNVATGRSSLYTNVSGSGNTATGNYALYAHSVGDYNVANGYYALYGNIVGQYNTALGAGALQYLETGDRNIGIGLNGGEFISTGSNNIEIGNYGRASDDGAIRIGTYGSQKAFWAAGIDRVQISGGVPVYINDHGQLGTVNSSIRFKEDIHDMADASSKLFQLRPVTYRYKQAYDDGSKPVDYGLIAEEVAKVYPDMVARDASGQILTVQYQKLTPMLLNEVQKQHRELEAQQEMIEKLEQRLTALEAANGKAAE